jgi:hypothetical protein
MVRRGGADCKYDQRVDAGSAQNRIVIRPEKTPMTLSA